MTTQTKMTPDAALAELKAGNQRFRSATPTQRDHLARARETAQAQSPHSAILACIDSRTAPEIIFDQGLGDVFCVRAAGNYAADDTIGALEFTTKVVGAKLIVVLAHTGCGAVMGACDNVKMGHLTQTLAHLTPALEAVTTEGDRASTNDDFVADVTKTNARLTAENIVRRSPILQKLIEQGDLKVAPALHHLATGEVEFL